MTLEPETIGQREAFLRDLARSAAEIALEGFVRQIGQPVGMKGPQDYLTETDGKVEAHVRSRIAEAFPEDGFLGEETGGLPGARAWVVDPIDGTANFARAIPHFCISIAFVANGQVELGAIVNPVLDESYFARRGQGARMNGKPIRVSATTEITATSFEMGWSNRRPTADYIAAVNALIGAGANVRRGACGALGLAYVADGRSDGYAELHMNSWDCLAGLLLVREAGGVTGPFLSMGGLTRGAPVLAATPAVAATLAAATGIPLLADADLLADPDAQILRTA
ncbi:inositol monophosphatase (plasmid) [Paracoccus denitrificans]|uniref:inositol monophosphatase family protein n=1 Tax=Paracoccus denitrificans TaxID=266 RepID=UPI001E57CB7D|nr:inositol monophosphatase family protein [Paracoccus denitrificans]UFS68215.1 inositol monophosphatase [Paracoccus denitrificans]